jgi:hypothetical protein
MTPSPEEPSLAYLDGGMIYCLHIVERLNSGPRLPRMELCMAKLTSDGEISKEKQHIRAILGPPLKDVLFRWRISPGMFWSANDRVGLTTLFGGIPLKKLHVGGFSVGRGGALGPVMAVAHRQFIRLLHDTKPNPDFDPQAFAIKDAFFDFLPGGKDEIYALLAWRGEVRAWRGILPPRDPEGHSDEVVMK